MLSLGCLVQELAGTMNTQTVGSLTLYKLCDWSDDEPADTHASSTQRCVEAGPDRPCQSNVVARPDRTRTHADVMQEASSESDTDSQLGQLGHV